MKTEARRKRGSSPDIAFHKARAQQVRAHYVRSMISSLFSRISGLGRGANVVSVLEAVGFRPPVSSSQRSA